MEPKAWPADGLADPLSAGLALLAEQVRQRRISPSEVLELCLGRISELSPLNAFVCVLEEQARAQARASEARILRGEAGPLEGVPIPIKDNVPLAGVPTSQGSRAVPDIPAPEDSPVVRRLRAAGALLVGKTNLPEFGAIPVTENLRYGVTENPVAPGRTAGGSSGGSAAAVAAGLVPAAHGNDGAGSLRIPASCCGLFTIKPSRGFMETGYLIGDAMGGMAVEGFLTRTVADQALLLDVATDWRGPRAPGSLPVPYSAGAFRMETPLRIGWTTVPPIPVPVAEDCQRAVAAAAELLAGLGHRVEQVDPGWQSDQAGPAFRGLWAVGMRATVLGLAVQGGDPDLVEPHIKALGELADQIGGAEYLVMSVFMQFQASQALRFWDEHDVLLTPSLAQPPLRVGELFQSAAEDPASVMDRADAFSPFTPFANITGQPAAQLPLGLSAEGIPLGVQAIGAQNSEPLLLALASQIEAAHGWTASPLGPVVSR